MSAAATIASTPGAVVTVRAAIGAIAPRLAAAGIAEARREARLLVALTLGAAPADVLGHPDRILAESEQVRLASLVARREAREPFSRLAGSRGFWSFDVALSPDTLDPRPDSETLIEAALSLLPERRAPLRVIDFGTGSGCLLIALLSELPMATGLGVDIAPGAAAMARRNAAALGLAARADFVVGDWGAAVIGEVDVILANPPYVKRGEIDGLAREVAEYEPRVALDGGTDGLVAYHGLAPHLRRLLKRGGIGVVEVGASQATAVAEVMAEAGLRLAGVRRDLAGIERCVILTPY